MKIVVRALALAAIVCSSWICSSRATAAEAAEVTPGQRVFLRKNCEQCHAVASQGITRKRSGKTAGPDLSDVGARKSYEQIHAFLEHSGPLGGANHWKAFWGSREELDSVALWLASLRTEPPKKDEASRRGKPAGG